ncbi:hypothetical protein Tco_1393576 [Tanacetum coccineum]
MSTSTTHQQSLVDVGSETRPLMLKRDDLTRDDLKHYKVEIEAMNLILISIPNDIYNFMDDFTTKQAMWQRVERLVRGNVQNKVYRETRFNNEFDQFVVEPGEELVLVYNRFVQLRIDLEQNGIKFPRVTVNTKFLNYLQPEWLNEKGYYARNCPKTKVQDSKYFMEQMLLAKQDEAGVTLTDEQNDFLVADATWMEEIEELSANICLMARIQPVNIDSDEEPSYDSAFLSEVQKPSISYENPLFAKDNQEQKYPKQPKIINNTLGDDQIDSNIIFDEPNVDVNSGSVEYDNNVQASYELEKLARNAYKEAKKQQIIAKKHEKERRKCESSLKTICETSWISKMEKLENENVSLKCQTYAYVEERAQNQDLLITISELKSKLKNIEKGKSVNTKFDKTNVSNQLLCVTPLNKQVFQKKIVAPKIEEKHVLSKTVTLQTSPNKKKDVETNQNVIAPGLYKATKQ